MIDWEKINERFHQGRVDGDPVCCISMLWTGFWLDGFVRPIRCNSLDEAKSVAESEVQKRLEGVDG